MGITIKDAPLVEQLSGSEKIPISDGSNEPRTVNIEQIKEFANKDIEIPTKVSELENDSGYATSKEVEDAISKIPTPDVGGQISAALVDYVKKVEGKGLSTNDFTNELKAKLETIIPNDISELEAEIGKLETTLNTLVGGNASNAIESFNEIIAFLKNVSDTESLSSIIAGINTRIAEVEAKIPTKVSELENDKNYLTEHQSLSNLATKDELKSKQDIISDLANIREGAAKGATAIQEEQYKGTIAAVDTDESVDDPNIPSASYDDTEIKEQIANLETEVSKKADEADTASKLSELGRKVGSSSIFNSDSRFEWTNQWIDDDGNGIQVAPLARAYFYNVRGLKKLYLSLSSLGGSKAYYHYVFFNSETPNSDSIMADFGVKEGETANEYVGEVEVPDGAVLLGINIRTDLGYNNDVSIIDYGYLLDQSAKNKINIDDLEEGLSFYNYSSKIEWINAWIGSDGNEKPINRTSRAYFYPVSEGDKIKLSLSAITGPSDYYHYAFYNSENPSPDSLMAEYSHLRVYNSDLNTVVEVPNGAKLIGISVWIDKKNSISFAKIGEKLESFIPLQRNVESVTDIITKPISIEKSVFGVLQNGQGITEEEAKEAFLGVYTPEDLKTNYIRIDSERFISFKKVSDNSDYGRTSSIDYTRDEAVVYPIFKDYFDTIKKEVVGYIILNASKIVRASYGTKYVYLVGNKGEYCQFHSSYNSVTEIVLLGDSLTALGSGYANFFDVNGCGRTPFGVGGERPTQIMGRIGVAPFRLKEDVVIPSEPTAVSIKLISSFDDKETYPRNNYGLHECVIGGVKGSINVTTAGSAVTFTRSGSGEEVVLKEGTDVESCYYGKTNTFNVYWMGQNGYGSDDELVDAFKLCVANQVNNYYLVLTPHLNTSDELEQKMQRTFGNRYINMRRWCMLFGLSESGITPTEADMEAVANNQCPPSLLSDGTHFVESARQAIGKMISNKVAYIIGR